MAFSGENNPVADGSSCPTTSSASTVQQQQQLLVVPGVATNANSAGTTDLLRRRVVVTPTVRRQDSGRRHRQRRERATKAGDSSAFLAVRHPPVSVGPAGGCGILLTPPPPGSAAGTTPSLLSDRGARLAAIEAAFASARCLSLAYRIEYHRCWNSYRGGSSGPRMSTAKKSNRFWSRGGMKTIIEEGKGDELYRYRMGLLNLQQQRVAGLTTTTAVASTTSFSGVRGLRNRGQTCFLNCVLQALASSAYFVGYLEGIAFVMILGHEASMTSRIRRRNSASAWDESSGSSSEEEESSSSRKQLSDVLLDTLLSLGGKAGGPATAAGSYPPASRGVVGTGPLDATPILRRVAAHHRQFRNNALTEQQDAEELMQALLGVVVDEAAGSNLLRLKPGWRYPGGADVASGTVNGGGGGDSFQGGLLSSVLTGDAGDFGRPPKDPLDGEMSSSFLGGADVAAAAATAADVTGIIREDEDEGDEDEADEDNDDRSYSSLGSLSLPTLLRELERMEERRKRRRKKKREEEDGKGEGEEDSSNGVAVHVDGKEDAAAGIRQRRKEVAEEVTGMEMEDDFSGEEKKKEDYEPTFLGGKVELVVGSAAEDEFPASVHGVATAVVENGWHGAADGKDVGDPRRREKKHSYDSSSTATTVSATTSTSVDEVDHQQQHQLANGGDDIIARILVGAPDDEGGAATVVSEEGEGSPRLPSSERCAPKSPPADAETERSLSPATTQPSATKPAVPRVISSSPPTTTSVGESPSSPLARMLTSLTTTSPSPLTGWLGSCLQCCECHHVRPIRNSPFVDLPIVPTSVTNHLEGKGRATALRSASKMTSPASFLPGCSLHDCLANFTSMERVSDVECTNCAIVEERSRIEDEIDLLGGAIESTERRGQDASELRVDLGRYEARLNALSNVDPDGDYHLLHRRGDDDDDGFAFDDPSDCDGGGYSDGTRSSAIALGSDGPPLRPRRTTALKCLLMTRLPSVLCLHVQRRYYDAGTDRMMKAAQHVSFPEVLDVSDYCAYSGTRMTRDSWAGGGGGDVGATAAASPGRSDGGGIHYRLMSVVEHRGNAHGGHYQTYRRIVSGRDRGRWSLVSDENVIMVNWDDVRMCQAYMLFYEAM